MAFTQGQDSTITVGGFVEKITQKFIALSGSKASDMQSFIKSHAGPNGLSSADLNTITTQGMQNAGDNLALAIAEAFKELPAGSAIVSDMAQDPNFWQYQTSISVDVNAILAALTTLGTTMSADGFDPAVAAAGAALLTSVGAITPLSPASKAMSYMKP